MCQPADGAKHFLHGGRLPQHFLVGQGIGLGHGIGTALDRIHGPADEFDRLLDIEWLGQVFKGAALERGHGTVQIREGRHDDDRQLWQLLLHTLQQIQAGQAVRIRHADIADQHQRLPVALPQRRQYL